MATQQSATVNITNNSGGNAWILLFHSNSSNGTQRGSWMAAPGQTVGPLKVFFKTGLGTESILDFWSVMVQVQDGPAPGLYVSSGTDFNRYWKECQLQRGDANQTLTFSVDRKRLHISLRSGGGSDEAGSQIADHARVRGDAGEPFVRQPVRDVGYPRDHGRHHR